MWRLIMFIILCALFLFFVGVNLEHTSDISIGFHTFVDIPVFLITFSSFLIGMLFAIPLALSFGKKRKKSAKTAPTPSITDREGKESGNTIFGKAAGKTADKVADKAAFDDAAIAAIYGESGKDGNKNDGVKKEKSPYGID